MGCTAIGMNCGILCDGYYPMHSDQSHDSAHNCARHVLFDNLKLRTIFPCEQNELVCERAVIVISRDSFWLHNIDTTSTRESASRLTAIGNVANSFWFTLGGRGRRIAIFAARLLLYHFLFPRVFPLHCHARSSRLNHIVAMNNLFSVCVYPLFS